MTDLLALAERCEREEPSRALDLEIFRIEAPDCVGDAMLAADTAYHINSPLLRTLAGHEFYLAVPHYCGSLDEAVSLVPDNFSFELAFSAAGDGAIRRARLWDWRRGPLVIDPANEWVATAKSVPLALCAASLRARAFVSSRQAA